MRRRPVVAAWALMLTLMAVHGPALGRSPVVSCVELPVPADRVSAAPRPDGGVDVAVVSSARVWYTAAASDLRFTPPIRLPGAPPVINGPERRAQIAAGPGGLRFVLWQTRDGLQLVRSTDAGRSWQPVPNVAPGARDLDVPALAADADGRVAVVWTDARDGNDPDDLSGQPLYLALSRNGGRSFDAPRCLTRNAPRACSCCVPALRIQAGVLWVAYRATSHNHKDIHLLRVDDGAIDDRAISHQAWEFHGCPHDGPSLALDGSDRMAICFTEDARLYFAASADRGRTWSAARDLGAAAPHGMVFHRRHPIVCWRKSATELSYWAGEGSPSAVVARAGGALTELADGRVLWVEGAPAQNASH